VQQWNFGVGLLGYLENFHIICDFGVCFLGSLFFFVLNFCAMVNSFPKQRNKKRKNGVFKGYFTMLGVSQIMT
jgi:hypothetical protein